MLRCEKKCEKQNIRAIKHSYGPSHSVFMCIQEVIYKWLYDSYRRSAHNHMKNIKLPGHQKLMIRWGEAKPVPHVIACKKKSLIVRLAVSSTQNHICSYWQTSENNLQALVSITTVCAGRSAMFVSVSEQPCSLLRNPCMQPTCSHIVKCHQIPMLCHTTRRLIAMHRAHCNMWLMMWNGRGWCLSTWEWKQADPTSK